jgi:hypothetical protein
MSSKKYSLNKVELNSSANTMFYLFIRMNIHMHYIRCTIFFTDKKP